MTPRKAGRRKSRTGRRKSIKAWAALDEHGNILDSSFGYGLLSVFKTKPWPRLKNIRPPHYQRVPCEILIGKAKAVQS